MDTSSSAWRPCGRNSLYSTERSKSATRIHWAELFQGTDGLPGGSGPLDAMKLAGREPAGRPHYSNPASAVWPKQGFNFTSLGLGGFHVKWGDHSRTDSTQDTGTEEQASRRLHAQVLEQNCLRSSPGSAAARVTWGKSLNITEPHCQQ